jgi:hypothetical protein
VDEVSAFECNVPGREEREKREVYKEREEREGERGRERSSPHPKRVRPIARDKERPKQCRIEPKTRVRMDSTKLEHTHAYHMNVQLEVQKKFRSGQKREKCTSRYCLLTDRQTKQTHEDAHHTRTHAHTLTNTSTSTNTNTRSSTETEGTSAHQILLLDRQTDKQTHHTYTHTLQNRQTTEENTPPDTTR